jgi:thiol-disulfide isomerase/thioredoxin
LPADFLSTPFGAALRPTIDAMFRRPVTDSTGPFLHAPNSQSGSTTVQSAVPESSQLASRTRSLQEETSSLIHTCTHLVSFHSLLNTHRAVVAFFTNAMCGPCGMIQPVFIDLAKESEGKDSIVFTKIDLGVAGSVQVADKWQVRVTPTFLFFLDGKLVKSLRNVTFWH